MRSAFIRGLWGVPHPEAPTRLARSRWAIVPEIQQWKKCLSSVPFKTYAFGLENVELLSSIGIQANVLSEKPEMWDNIKECFRHKIEIIRCALKEYDEVVWLDWDCYPIAPLPDNFWSRIAEGQPYKACLKKLGRPHCMWRDTRDNQLYIPSGGFIYMRGLDMAEKLVKHWEEIGGPDNDEYAMAKLGDVLSGGWNGPREYCLMFEPFCCTTKRCRVCPEDLEVKKEKLFWHAS